MTVSARGNAESIVVTLVLATLHLYQVGNMIYIYNSRFDQFFYIEEVNKTENFFEVLNNITEYRLQMNQQIKENIKELKRLNKIIAN